MPDTDISSRGGPAVVDQAQATSLYRTGGIDSAAVTQAGDPAAVDAPEFERPANPRVPGSHSTVAFSRTLRRTWQSKVALQGCPTISPRWASPVGSKGKKKPALGRAESISRRHGGDEVSLNPGALNAIDLLRRSNVGRGRPAFSGSEDLILLVADLPVRKRGGHDQCRRRSCPAERCCRPSQLEGTDPMNCATRRHISTGFEYIGKCPLWLTSAS
ncbi:UNVERIFIED_ORG: hypothetical protein BDU10_9536 [Burkholderia sp. CF145]